MKTDEDQSKAGYSSLGTVSKKMFAMICGRLNVPVAYVTKREHAAITVLSSYNHTEEIIPEGYIVEYSSTYCRHIIENGMMSTSNLMQYSMTKDLTVTGDLKMKGFLGVTLKDVNGNVFGTLCVMDRDEKEFSKEDAEYLSSMAELLSHIIELDRAKYDLGILSVPIIPITDGISILSLQGTVDEIRSEKIISDVLENASHHGISCFIIDLSKLHVQDELFSNLLFTLTEALKLMGTDTIITGVTADFAIEQYRHRSFEQIKASFAKDISFALGSVGYQLIEK